MNENTDIIQTKLEALRQAYRQQLPDKIAEIETLFNELDSEQTDLNRFHTLHRLSHNLAGSGTTFGFPSVSTSARSLEKYLKNLLTRPGKIAKRQLKEIDKFIKTLRQSSEQSNKTKMPDSDLLISTPPDKQAIMKGNLVYLVEDEISLANELTIQLQHFGYTVKQFESPNKLLQDNNSAIPDIIIMDIVFPEGESAGIEIANKYRAKQGNPTPIVFISSRDDIDARLQAVRSGGLAYFTKPVDIETLIDKLDSITDHTESDPYQILIVDDSRHGNHHCPDRPVPSRRATDRRAG